MSVIESVPIVFVPGLNCTARVYADQIPQLWRLGPVMIADHTRDDSIEAIARSILATAPPRFALVGFSMGGYLAFEMWRQASARIARLALLDTSARPDSAEQAQHRLERIAAAQAGRFDETIDQQYPLVVHSSRRRDEMLRERYRAMVQELGAEVFVRHQKAVMHRPDSRPNLAAIQCPTVVLVGDGDNVTPPAHAEEMAAGIKGARLVVVPECGHFSPIERPESVTQALVEWMRG